MPRRSPICNTDNPVRTVFWRYMISSEGWDNEGSVKGSSNGGLGKEVLGRQGIG